MTHSAISGGALAGETRTPLLPQAQMAEDALDTLPHVVLGALATVEMSAIHSGDWQTATLLTRRSIAHRTSRGMIE